MIRILLYSFWCI